MAGQGCPRPAGEARVLLRVGRPRLAVGWLAAEGSREAFWASRGHGKVLLPWMGFLPFWAVGGVLTANLHLFLSQHRAKTADQYGARGPEAPPRIT